MHIINFIMANNTNILNGTTIIINIITIKGRRGLSTLLNSGSIQKHSSYQALLLKVMPLFFKIFSDQW